MRLGLRGVTSWQELSVLGVEIRGQLLNISRLEMPHELLVHGVNDLGNTVLVGSSHGILY